MRTAHIALVVLLSLFLLPSCLPAAGGPDHSAASAPGILSVAEDENPDVLWIVRAVQVDGEVFFGLFACYRKSAKRPGPPTCYLAQMEGDESSLSWPAPVQLDDGSGVIRRAR